MPKGCATLAENFALVFLREVHDYWKLFAPTCILPEGSMMKILTILRLKLKPSVNLSSDCAMVIRFALSFSLTSKWFHLIISLECTAD